jgi:hypothetical protein
METIFDHKKKSLAESLNFDLNDIHEINSKLANMSKHVIMTTCEQSELCEEIAKTFSYNELLFITTLFVTEKTAHIVGQHPQLVAMMKLRDLLEDLNKEEE